MKFLLINEQFVFEVYIKNGISVSISTYNKEKRNCAVSKCLIGLLYSHLPTGHMKLQMIDNALFSMQDNEWNFFCSSIRYYS